MARTKSVLRSRRQAPDRQQRAEEASIWLKATSLFPPRALLWSWIKSSYGKMDILGYQQRNVLHEYGPAFWATLLSLPGVAFLRRLLRRFRADTYDGDAPTPLLELPDELLVMILTHLEPVCQDCSCFRYNQHRRDFVSLVKTNRRIRSVALPFLYRDVAIVHGWYRASRALRVIAGSPDIGKNVRTLKLAPFIRAGTGWLPEYSLAPELASVLPTLTKLHTLHVHIPYKHTLRFRREFERTSSCFLHMRGLVLGPYMDFIIRYCPNVESIASIGWQWMAAQWPMEDMEFRPHTLWLLRGATNAAKLRTFQLDEDWRSYHIEQIAKAMPHLERLAMLGRFRWDGPLDLLPMLRRLPDLKDLAIPDVSNLGIGVHRQGVCGTPFTGPGGKRRVDEETRRRQKQDLAAGRPIADFAFRQLPGLRRLWIGSSMLFTPVCDAGGARIGVDFRYEHRPTPPTLGLRQ